MKLLKVIRAQFRSHRLSITIYHMMRCYHVVVCSAAWRVPAAGVPGAAHRARGVARRRARQARRPRGLRGDALHGALRAAAAPAGTLGTTWPRLT